ncbi:MAG: WGR domain-containing protein [Geminicoccaceae bacterium]
MNADDHSAYLEHSEEGRFYALRRQPTLFGWPSVLASWGGLDNNLGGFQLRTFDDDEQAEAFIKAKLKEKKRRGYQPPAY